MKNGREQNEMLRKIEEAAREAGVAALGIARAGTAPHRNFFIEWLAAGNHADMEWLARNPEVRTDVRMSLPSTQSLVVSAFPIPQAGAGPIAVFARGRDYHRWIPKCLRPLLALMQSLGGEQRLFVDSSPLLERDFAVEAGLGWTGKSGLIVHPRIGSRFFLATIATTLDLPASEKQPSRCADCECCLQACPTRALVAPYTLDARKCLSYWLIEHKGSIPEEIREKIGNRIFGCDTCADVCPWNQTAETETWVSEPPPLQEMPLRNYLAFDEIAFDNFFAGTPVRRCGYAAFLRNVCIALGNTGSIHDLPALEVASAHALPLIAEHALWAIQQLQRK